MLMSATMKGGHMTEIARGPVPRGKHCLSMWIEGEALVEVRYESSTGTVLRSEYHHLSPAVVLRPHLRWRRIARWLDWLWAKPIPPGRWQRLVVRGLESPIGAESFSVHAEPRGADHFYADQLEVRHDTDSPFVPFDNLEPNHGFAPGGMYLGGLTGKAKKLS